MKLLQRHRRAVISCIVIVVPLVTWIVSEGLAQMRLAGSMADAAGRLLASLSPEQKERLNFSFESLERFNWHYIPRMRKGLPLRELRPEQKTLALNLLRTGLSASGYETTEKIRRLERILLERERNGSMPMVRDPENYYVVVFGTPSAERPWGWRFEGHHISVNVTVASGRVRAASSNGADVVANTPLFFGAEPAEVQGGPMKGLRVLGGIEDKARTLINALDPQQRKEAVVSMQLPPDLFAAKGRTFELGSQLNPIGLDRQPERLQPAGLTAAKMTPRQRELLKALVDEYLSRMPEDIASTRAREVAADFDRIEFAWIGATRAEDAATPPPGFGCTPGDTRWECIPLGFAYYYRVQGPSFLIEYINTSGNHSHSLWRDFQNGDFGEDLLQAHYAEVPHDGIPAARLLATR